MQVVHFEDTALEQRGLNHRVGTFRFKNMGEGEPGSPSNYYLRIVSSQGDFFSPRHRHNFEQVRVQLEGTFKFAEDGVMHPGSVGYFPEGTPYGPQTSDDDTLQLVLQIGGPSGCGYVSEAERVAGVDALSRDGSFRDGRYFAHGSTSELGADAFEAVWEYARKQKIRYPVARFEKPMLANPQAFPSEPCEGALAKRKVLWDLGTRTVGCSAYSIGDAGRLQLQGPLSAFIVSGEGRVTGNGNPSGFAKSDAIHLADGESARFDAASACEILVFSHPRFD